MLLKHGLTVGHTCLMKETEWGRSAGTHGGSNGVRYEWPPEPAIPITMYGCDVWTDVPYRHNSTLNKLVSCLLMLAQCNYSRGHFKFSSTNLIISPQSLDLYFPIHFIFRNCVCVHIIVCSFFSFSLWMVLYGIIIPSPLLLEEMRFLSSLLAFWSTKLSIEHNSQLLGVYQESHGSHMAVTWLPTYFMYMYSFPQKQYI